MDVQSPHKSPSLCLSLVRSHVCVYACVVRGEGENMCANVRYCRVKLYRCPPLSLPRPLHACETTKYPDKRRGTKLKRGPELVG